MFHLKIPSVHYMNLPVHIYCPSANLIYVDDINKIIIFIILMVENKEFWWAILPGPYRFFFHMDRVPSNIKICEKNIYISPTTM